MKIWRRLVLVPSLLLTLASPSFGQDVESRLKTSEETACSKRSRTAGSSTTKSSAGPRRDDERRDGISRIVNPFFHHVRAFDAIGAGFEIDSGIHERSGGRPQGVQLQFRRAFHLRAGRPVPEPLRQHPRHGKRDGVGGSLFRHFLPARRSAGQGRQVQERLRPHQRPASPRVGFRRCAAQLPRVHGDGRDGRGEGRPVDLAPGSSRLPSTGSRSAARRERPPVRRRREGRPPCVHGVREDVAGYRGQRNGAVRPLFRQGESEHPDGGRQYDLHRGYRSVRFRNGLQVETAKRYGPHPTERIPLPEADRRSPHGRRVGSRFHRRPAYADPGRDLCPGTLPDRPVAHRRAVRRAGPVQEGLHPLGDTAGPGEDSPGGRRAPWSSTPRNSPASASSTPGTNLRGTGRPTTNCIFRCSWASEPMPRIPSEGGPRCAR